MAKLPRGLVEAVARAAKHIDGKYCWGLPHYSLDTKLRFHLVELGDMELFDIESEMARKVTVTEKNLRMYRRLFGDFQERVKGYGTKYGLGCTRTSTEIPFDELILKMMRVAGAVR